MKEPKKRGVKPHPQSYIDEKYKIVLELVKNGENIRTAIRKTGISDEVFYKRITPLQLAELQLEKKLNTKYSFKKLY